MRRLETRDWWPELLAQKDELSLRELAEKFDVTPGAISAALKRTGTGRDHAPPGPRAYRKGRSEEELPPEPEEKAAKGKAKAAPPAPAPKATRPAPPAPAPRAAAPSAPAARPAAEPESYRRSDGRQAWKITIRSGVEEFSRVVIARDLIDAASRARDAQVAGQVVGLALVGDIL